MEFPTLLVVTEFPPNSTPPLTIQCLRGYPPDKIYWWSCKAESNHFLGQKYARHFHAHLHPKLLPQRRFADLKSALLERLWMPAATAHLRKVVQQVRPQQVWANLYGWVIGPVQFSGVLDNIPSHVTIWDFPDIAQNQLSWGVARSRRMLDWAHSIYKRAKTRSVISEEMRQNLAQQTGRGDAIVIHSGLEAADIDKLVAAQPQADNVLRIAYAGGINVPDVFALWISDLDKVRHRLPTPVQLEFFGTDHIETFPWFDSSWMRSHGMISEVDLMSAMRRCSWGFLALELAGTNLRYSQFSFPNKFGTYLAAGLPLLLLSHVESASARVLRNYGLGVHLDHMRLESHLNEVLRFERPREMFRPALLACATSEFSMERIRRELWHALGVKG